MRLSRLSPLVVLCAVACGSTPKPAPVTPPEVALDPEPEFSGTPVDAPVVTLLQAGTGPKAKLRYAPKKGARMQMDVVMNMDVTMGMSGTTVPVKTPPMKMTMETVITRVSATTFDAAARVTATDVAPGGDPAMTKAMQTQLAKLIGMTTTMRMDRRGVLQAADIAMPAGTDSATQQMMEMMRQSMTQATAPLPEEAVGVGATWNVKSRIKNSMMMIDQTSVFELTQLDGNRGTATMQISQDAPPQAVHVPNQPADMTATLDSVKSSGSGTLTFDLVAVVPVAFDLATQMDMAMTVKPGTGKPMSMSMSMGMGVTMAATPLAN